MCQLPDYPKVILRNALNQSIFSKFVTAKLNLPQTLFFGKPWVATTRLYYVFHC